MRVLGSRVVVSRRPVSKFGSRGGRCITLPTGASDCVRSGDCVRWINPLGRSYCLVVSGVRVVDSTLRITGLSPEGGVFR